MDIFNDIRNSKSQKKMVIPIKKHIFVTSFIIALGIFLIGFYFARVWDDLRINQVDDSLIENNLDTMSITIEQEFLTSFNASSCSISESRLSSISKNLFDLGNQLVEYEKKGLLRTKEYDRLRREYFLLEIRAYSNFINFAKKCNSDLNVILYFYSINQDLSERQGYALDAVVNRDDVKIRVLSIDKDFNDTTLDMVKSFYNVTEAPTIIINDKYKKSGFISISEILDLVKRKL